MNQQRTHHKLRARTRQLWLRVIPGCVAAGVVAAGLTATALSAAEGKLAGATAQAVHPSVLEISAVRYAPPDTYLKDHCLIRKDKQWHLFAPLGKVGTMWRHPGSEESAEHMVSDDLVHWRHLGTSVPASQREGCFDRLMGGIAPHVIEHAGNYFMFYAGWTFRSKQPLNMQDFRQGIGLALSKDLVHWEKSEEFAQDGLGARGSDQCVVRDESQERWLMYVHGPTLSVYESQDLRHWSEAGTALERSDLAGDKTEIGQAESPFVMKHPRSGKWILILNAGYSVSENPLKFPHIQPYPFKAGAFLFPDRHDEGKGTFYHAEDDGAGFAHEIIEFSGQWYMTGAVGTDGHTKLKFTPIAWTEDALTLAPVSALLLGTNVAGAKPSWPEETTDKWRGFTRHVFKVDGCTAWVVEPPQPAPGNPWTWCMAFPDAFTDRTGVPRLLDKGFFNVHIQVGNTFGCPAALKHFDAFYHVITEKGLAKKGALIGISRGGLYAYNWAAENPDKVTCIYGDAPVCDFKSWPGGKGAGKGSPADWRALIKCYGFKDEAEALAWKGNPVDTLAPLAKAKIPLIHVIGDSDDVVPPKENTAIIEQRYRGLGGDIKVIHKPGVGHHPHGLDEPQPLVDFIQQHQD